MKYITSLDLSENEKKLIEDAFMAAEHSISSSGHKVGCAILCENGEIFKGATNSRMRAIGSTCAERMAVGSTSNWMKADPQCWKMIS